MDLKISRSLVCFAALALASLNGEGICVAQDAQKAAAAQPAGKLEAIPVKVLKKISLPKGYHEGLYFDGKNIWVNNGKKGKTWVVDPGSGAVLSEIAPVATFTEGLTRKKDGDYFVTDWDTMKLYRSRVEDGRMVADSEVYSFAPAHPTGVVWTGAHLFVITWTRGAGTQFHLLQMEETGRLLRKMRIKWMQEPAHLAWDGKYLWITSWYSRLVYKIDIGAWKIIGCFRSPVSDATGIAWDGQYLWLTGTSGDLYQLQVGSN